MITPCICQQDCCGSLTLSAGAGSDSCTLSSNPEGTGVQGSPRFPMLLRAPPLKDPQHLEVMCAGFDGIVIVVEAHKPITAVPILPGLRRFVSSASSLRTPKPGFRCFTSMN